jgi:hypothetical protein
VYLPLEKGGGEGFYDIRCTYYYETVNKKKIRKLKRKKSIPVHPDKEETTCREKDSIR